MVDREEWLTIEIILSLITMENLCLEVEPWVSCLVDSRRLLDRRRSDFSLRSRSQSRSRLVIDNRRGKSKNA